MGRLSTYTPEVAEAICERLAAGESLRAICRDEGMPHEATVRQWALADVGGFHTHYANARDIGLDSMADHVIEIADDPVGALDNGATDSGAVADKRLRFDARRWYLSKLAPKRYGDRQAVEMSGSLALGEMSEADIKAELATLLASGLEPKDGSDLV